MTMHKTPFSNKVDILGKLWLDYHAEQIWDENWITFFKWADVALPLAYMQWQNLADINNEEEGPELIEATWNVFCGALSIDPDAEYKTLDDCLDASPNPEMETFEHGQR